MTIRIEEKKHLSTPGLLKIVRECFAKIPSSKRGGSGKAVEISLEDCLMSGLAVFSLKFPSLLQFDKAISEEETIRHNLSTLYNVGKLHVTLKCAKCLMRLMREA